MKNVELKKGKMKQNNRDIYWQKSYIENISLQHSLLKIIVVTSYEYIKYVLKIPLNNLNNIESWINKQTDKLFEEYKLNPTKFPKDIIIREFFTEPFLDVDYFVENEA